MLRTPPQFPPGGPDKLPSRERLRKWDVSVFERLPWDARLILNAYIEEELMTAMEARRKEREKKARARLGKG